MDIILGCPWLNQHSPEVKWDPCEIPSLRPASKTVCPRSRNHSGNHCKSKCVSPSSNVLSLWWRVRSHLTTRRSRMYSASRQPLASHRIGHGTAPLTCCLRLNSQRVEFTLSPSQRARQWRIRSRRLSNKDSFSNRHPLLPPAFSSWAKRTEAWGHASTTEPWTHKQWSCLIHFPWSQPPSRNSVGPAYSPNWTCGA